MASLDSPLAPPALASRQERRRVRDTAPALYDDADK